MWRGYAKIRLATQRCKWPDLAVFWGKLAPYQAGRSRRSRRPSQVSKAAASKTGGNMTPLIVLHPACASSAPDANELMVMSSEGIALLLQSGWVSPELAERPSGVQGLSTRALGDSWQVFGNSRRELDRYWISYPANRPADQRFELEWRLRGLQWRIVAIRLPAPLVNRLAEQLTRIQRGR